jgi:hypothetical protein
MVGLGNAQDSTYRPGQVFTVGPTLPGACVEGAVFIITTISPSINVCIATNTWSVVGYASQMEGIPAGLIVVSLTACPVGFTEVNSLSGRSLIGTLNANGNVGTTGGNDNVTPSGSLALDALATHTHTFTGTIATASATATTPDLVTVNTAAAGVAPRTTATGTNSAISAGTPTGTFTGTQFDNRAAFTRVIFCQKT